MIVKSKTGPIEFSTNSQVDFAASSSGNPTQVSVYTTDDATNKPVQYLLQKNVFATSGKSKSFTVTVGNPQQFFKIRLPDNNIIRIIKKLIFQLLNLYDNHLNKF